MLGELIAGDRESYQYLVESIRQFPCPVGHSKYSNVASFPGRSHLQSLIICIRRSGHVW